ncbi:hypothetical protein [Amycolatopsis sp. WAC 01375]|uniref:hypothetical protein n=1 Tax=Amycolatopsis sp. WAC 01375 TaxID=2203194 RepID=UPI000F7B6119|nr:hypothetical protein [Amycolatopsis sp. WAC 01375]
MTAPAHNLTDDELQALADRLGEAVTRGDVARETAIGELLDKADGGLTPVGAGEAIDHWNYDLPDYAAAFEDLVGPVSGFAAVSPDEWVMHGLRLLTISTNSDAIERLGRDVVDGRRTRDDAITALRDYLDLSMSADDAGRLIDCWDTVGIRHSRAARHLARLISRRDVIPARG